MVMATLIQDQSLVEEQLRAPVSTAKVHWSWLPCQHGMGMGMGVEGEAERIQEQCTLEKLYEIWKKGWLSTTHLGR